jgi:hypothetical protein
MGRKPSTLNVKSGSEGANESFHVAGVELPRPESRQSARKPHKYAGEKTKLELYPFVHAIFVANEEQAVRKGGRPLTNAQIEDVVKTEFAAYPDLVAKIGTVPDYTVGKWRTFFNAGRLKVVNYQRVKPVMVSFRYNDKGEAIEARYGSAVLTGRQKWGIAKKSQIEDPRMKAWLEEDSPAESVSKQRRTAISQGTPRIGDFLFGKGAEKKT